MPRKNLMQELQLPRLSVKDWLNLNNEDLRRKIFFEKNSRRSFINQRNKELLPRFKSLDSNEGIYQVFPKGGKALKNLKIKVSDIPKSSFKQRKSFVIKNKQNVSKKFFEKENSKTKFPLKNRPFLSNREEKSENFRISKQSKRRLLTIKETKEEVNKILKDPLVKFIHFSKKEFQSSIERENKKRNLKKRKKRWSGFFCVCKKDKKGEALKRIFGLENTKIYF